MSEQPATRNTITHTLQNAQWLYQKKWLWLMPGGRAGLKRSKPPLAGAACSERVAGSVVKSVLRR